MAAIESGPGQQCVQLPEAQLLVAPGCGHEVMARRPALFNEAMMAFYRAARR